MSVHPEIELYLARKNNGFSGASPGIATRAAANMFLDHQGLKELMDVCEVNGHEVVITAGAFKIRPKDTAL